MSVDHRDGQPVVAGALGEGQAHDEDTDQEGARFEPGPQRTPGAFSGRSMIDGLRREEAPRRQRCDGAEGDRHPDQMPGHGDAEGHHQRPGHGPTDRPDAEAGVELRHDRAFQSLLDRGALHVHRHVPGAVAETDQCDADHDRDGADQHAEGQHHQTDRQADGHGGHAATRAEPGHDDAGQRHRDHGTQPAGQQDQPQGRRTGVQLVADRGEPRRPAGKTEPAADERDGDGSFRVLGDLVAGAHPPQPTITVVGGRREGFDHVPVKLPGRGVGAAVSTPFTAPDRSPAGPRT